jgi:hypothetical protein
MGWWTILLVAGSACLLAQQPMPVGIVRGDFVARSGSEFEIRDVQSILYSCLFDSRTFFERERQAIAVTELRAGDPVEVLADRRPGTDACYVRIVQVVDRRVLPLRVAPKPVESLAPRGNLTFAGRVVHSDQTRMTMRTRDGEISLILRYDTRYIDDGLRVDSATRLVNRHVFVRAGRNVEGKIEAYQIMWSDEMTGN